MKPYEIAAPPEGKEPYSHYSRRVEQERRDMKVKDLFPKSCHRLCWLENGDDQLNQMLDYFQSLGIPMGSEKWAAEIQSREIKKERDLYSFRRLINEWRENRKPDFQRLEDDLEHSRKMYLKFKVKYEENCDYCGWGGARLIGDGYKACEECLPKDKFENIA